MGNDFLRDIFLGVIYLVLLCSSCTVFEDRTSCPCFFSLDMKEAFMLADEDLLIGTELPEDDFPFMPVVLCFKPLSSNGSCIVDTIFNRVEKYECKLPRGEYNLFVCSYPMKSHGSVENPQAEIVKFNPEETSVRGEMKNERSARMLRSTGDVVREEVGAVAMDVVMDEAMEERVDVEMDKAYVFYGIERGTECAEVFTDVLRFNAISDELTQKVLLHKNFARLNIAVVLEAKNQVDYAIRIRGDVCGYDSALTENFEVGLKRGPFEKICFADSHNIFRCRVPRQEFNSLMMDIIPFKPVSDKNSPSASLYSRLNFEKAKSFSLGECIAATKYNWHVEDLPDITLEVNYVFSNLKVTVGQNSQEQEFNIEI